MGIMVYSLLWVVQDFVHQPKHFAPEDPKNRPGKMTMDAQPCKGGPSSLELFGFSEALNNSESWACVAVRQRRCDPSGLRLEGAGIGGIGVQSLGLRK